jgi:hypothetical protein
MTQAQPRPAPPAWPAGGAQQHEVGLRSAQAAAMALL